MAEPPILQTENLSHTYPNGVQALVDVNLDIYRGEYTALVGQNGSGKTTLAKHFNGLLRPTTGLVRLDGDDIRTRKVSLLSRRVGYVFQNPDDMLFCSSVRDEIAFGPQMCGMPRDEIETRVEHILEVLNLSSLRENHPFALSLGDRQRVAVACALSLDPEVFVFDEPTTGQDFFGGQSIMSIIDELHAQGRTIIIITHDMEMVARHARRVVVMSQGRVALDAPPAQAFTQLQLLETLSLRPPQVSLLARHLGATQDAILTVPQLVQWLQSTTSPKGGVA